MDGEESAGIVRKKLTGEADIFEEIISGKEHGEENIYEEAEGAQKKTAHGEESKGSEAEEEPDKKEVEEEGDTEEEAEKEEETGEEAEKEAGEGAEEREEADKKDEKVEGDTEGGEEAEKEAGDEEGDEGSEDDIEGSEGEIDVETGIVDELDIEEGIKEKAHGKDSGKEEGQEGAETEEAGEGTETGESEEGAEESAKEEDTEAEEVKGETQEDEEPAEEVGVAGAAEQEKMGRSRENIKKTIIDKAKESAAKDAGPHISIKLGFLEDKEKKNVFIGRKKSIYNKYGYDAALFVGRVREEEHNNSNIYLDSMNPHVVFVCGSRGSGKSYVLGVVAEELALNNRDVGVIAIDPIGVFWSMRFPNKEEREVEKLKSWGLKPKGLKNLKVFVPWGMVGEIPKSTYDAGFAIQPCLLTTEDWCLTYGMERFSPTGLLLDKAIKKVEGGYQDKETKKKVAGKKKEYSIDNIIDCLENDEELNSRERGYKQDSIRALVSRFEAAKSWGIFSSEGTPLSELSREGQLSVLDTSFLEDNVTALVIGVLARRVLAARKISTRKEAATQFRSMDVEKLLELEIPPTWLIIDEAHTLLPSGNERTPASASLIEYVKQGRRPGCSLALATQQPSAINTKVLSQLDIMITHKLVFDDDIKSIHKRMPTIVPGAYKKSNFIKTLPVGVALTGDRREETSRAFIMNIRPRMSQHEGRDTETANLSKKLTSEEVEDICYNSVLRDLEKSPYMERRKLEKLIETLNAKYRSAGGLASVIARLEKDKIIVNDKAIMLQNAKLKGMAADEIAGIAKGGETTAEGAEPEEILPEETKPETTGGEAVSTELLALPKRIDEKAAGKIAQKLRKKKLFGVMGKEEKVVSVVLKYITIWNVSYDAFATKSEFVSRKCFINSMTGEFLHFRKGQFVESRGMRDIYDMSSEEITVLKRLVRKEAMPAELITETGLSEAKVLRTINKLVELGMLRFAVDKKKGRKIYWMSDKVQLPPTERAALLPSISELPKERMEALPKERESFGSEMVIEGLKKLWPNVVVKKINEVYRPVYEITLEKGGSERKLLVDAINGEIA
jgi:hypothetical protein